jgi:hypothetical protein
MPFWNTEKSVREITSGLQKMADELEAYRTAKHQELTDIEKQIEELHAIHSEALEEHVKAGITATNLRNLLG